MKNSTSKRILSACLVILLYLGMLPTMMSTAYATIDGTVTFVSSDSTNIVRILHDGSAGSSNISEINLDIFNASSSEAALARTYTGSFGYFDNSNIGGLCSAIGFIDTTLERNLVNTEPPKD